MPAKRRQSKRRLGPAAELVAWSDLFDCGHDFFGDLEPLGFPGGDADRAAREAAQEAWGRLGAAFLAARNPDHSRSIPWALEEFGEPGEARHAR